MVEAVQVRGGLCGKQRGGRRAKSGVLSRVRLTVALVTLLGMVLGTVAAQAGTTAPSSSVVSTPTIIRNVDVINDPSGMVLDILTVHQGAVLDRQLSPVEPASGGHRLMGRRGSVLIVADSAATAASVVVTVTRYSLENGETVRVVLSSNTAEARMTEGVVERRTRISGGAWTPYVRVEGPLPTPHEVACGAITGAIGGVACYAIPIAGPLVAGICGAVAGAAGVYACAGPDGVTQAYVQPVKCYSRGQRCLYYGEISGAGAGFRTTMQACYGPIGWANGSQGARCHTYNNVTVSNTGYFEILDVGDYSHPGEFGLDTGISVDSGRLFTSTKACDNARDGFCETLDTYGYFMQRCQVVGACT